MADVESGQRSDAEWAPAACACAPCSTTRAQSAPVPFIIVFVILLNYIPYVFWAVQRGLSIGVLVAMFTVWHVFLALVVVSWVYTCCTDPGTPPAEWQRQADAAAKGVGGVGGAARVCRKSGLYKPERSHYCSVTRRLTLNMDHFCPWVTNTVGFYNRKFFLLFVFYLIVLLAYTLLTLAPQLPGLFDWAMNGENRWFSGIVSIVLLVLTLLIDGLLLILLCPFFWLHFKMAMRNETTIDGSRFPHFDVGTHANLQQVFGRNVWVWLLPLYCSGPDGDGVHWPVRQGEPSARSDAQGDGSRARVSPPGGSPRPDSSAADSPPPPSSAPSATGQIAPVCATPAVPTLATQLSCSTLHRGSSSPEIEVAEVKIVRPVAGGLASEQTV